MNYVPIRLSTLRTNVQLNFDVYLKLKTKYLCYVRNGDKLHTDRFNSLKEKKIRQLFIVDSDEPTYQSFLDQELDDALNNENLSSEDRATITTGAASASIEDFRENPTSKTAFDRLVKAAQSLRQVIDKGPDVLEKIFAKTKDEGDKVIVHSINVASLATSFAQLMELDLADIENIGVAGLLHDIGIYQLSPEVQMAWTLPYSEMPQESLKAYKQHPKMSYELLQDKNYVNKEILDLILNHEERKSGSGYPEGKKNLSLKQEVLGIASCYDRKVTCYKMNYSDALKNVQINELGNFDLELINKFKSLLKKRRIVF